MNRAGVAGVARLHLCRPGGPGQPSKAGQARQDRQARQSRQGRQVRHGAQRELKWSQKGANIGQNSSWGSPGAPLDAQEAKEGAPPPFEQHFWSIWGTLWDPPEPPGKLCGIKREACWQQKERARALFFRGFLRKALRLTFRIDFGALFR